MSTAPVYNPNDPAIYVPYTTTKTVSKTSTTSTGCHLCNLCQIENGSDLQCRCPYMCARHTKDSTIVMNNTSKVDTISSAKGKSESM